MPERVKARLLTVVWGERYVREFAEISLPSYLSPGNIPALAENVDLEVVVLTTKASLNSFRNEPSFLRLQALCNTRFLLIDDLITTGNYGVILTFAYARGIIDAGAKQLDTWFIFMNSDFVLADGGMRNLLPLLATQNHAIMSASLRVRAEPVLPLLNRYIAENGIELSIKPREAVRLALANLHSTVIGKTITQNLVTCGTHNQIYWGVDESTILARNHLIFMLAIKPETPMRAVNSYCDYGLVPELVPSGKIHVIGDSDVFFMMEIQPSQQEANFVSYGTKSLHEIAQELSGWTTKEHRLYAQQDVIFHAKDIPPLAERSRSAATRFITELHGQLRAAKDHVNHFYWVRGLEAWFSLRAISGGGKLPVPPEMYLQNPSATYLEPTYQRVAAHYSLKGGYVHLATQFKRLLGCMPYVSIIHPDWIDSQMLLSVVRSQRPGSKGKNLLILDELNPATLRLSHEFNADFISLVGSMTLSKRVEGGKVYENIMIMIDLGNANNVGRIIHELYLLQCFTNCVNVYISRRHRVKGGINNDLSHSIADILPNDWLGYEYTVISRGGRLKHLLSKSQFSLEQILIDFQMNRLPKFVLSMALYPITLVLTAVCNVWAGRSQRNCTEYMSSVLISMRRRYSIRDSDPIAFKAPICT